MNFWVRNERKRKWVLHSRRVAHGWTFSWWWGWLLILCVYRANNTK
jgi:hypothetical protein